MMRLRPEEERGRAQFGWLDSRHSFSFGHYLDPAHMGHGPLRVINEDRVAPGKGFDRHGHRDMEILSYVLAGTLQHEDSLGTGSAIVPGDLQRMSAGTGVMHSEYNGSTTEPVHFLQIWIQPERQGMAPGYEQRTYTPEQKRNQLCLIGARDGREGAVTIHRDVDLYASLLEADRGLEYALAPARSGWLQLARGALRVNDVALKEGDGLALEGPLELDIRATADAEFLLFDMR
ncbi:MAG: pirin family protein [Halieaceae bacterium]|jgi:redox-sensitive bicupin YhaK (pirin superfamily)|nr:pirin family protein [Halieaceae bacterium]